MFGRLGRYIFSRSRYEFPINDGSSSISGKSDFFLFGICFFSFLMNDITAHVQQALPLPPMSLQDIRQEITQIESAEYKLQHYVEMSNRCLLTIQVLSN